MATAFAMPAPLLSEESIELVRRALANPMSAQEQRAISYLGGSEGYILEAPAKVIVPVITPLVNMIPRRQSTGAPIVHWKAVGSFDTANIVGGLTNSAAPSNVSYSFRAFQNIFGTIAIGNQVDFEAQWVGMSLEGDNRARRVAELLYRLKQLEERWIINASQVLMVPPAPVVSVSTTGGNALDSTTYWVQVTAINANGETTGSGATKVTTGTPGNTSTLNITVFTVWNATGYNVYVGSGATQPATSAMWKQSSVSGNSNAAQPAFGATVPVSGGPSINSGEVFGPIISLALTAAIATSGTALSSVSSNTAQSLKDGNGNNKMFDGILAQALNTVGAGYEGPLTATSVQPAASTGILALSDIDNALLSANMLAAADPDFLVCNPVTHKKITQLYVNAGQVRNNIDASQPLTQGQLTANYRVTHYLNQATGKEMPIIPDRYCPMDTILCIPMAVPFPSAEISNAIEIETAREYWGVDFAITDSSYKFADYVMEAPKLYFPGGTVVIRGILPAI